jgi:hypothetical protein
MGLYVVVNLGPCWRRIGMQPVRPLDHFLSVSKFVLIGIVMPLAMF